MKKAIIILLCILLVFIILEEILFMTRNKQNNSISENSNVSSLNVPPNNDVPPNNNERSIEKVKMTIKEESLTPSSATIIIIDDNEKPYIYDEWFRIDKKVNNSWKKSNIINKNYTFLAIAYNVDKTGKIEKTIDWSNLYGNLNKGSYRLIKHVYDNEGNEIYFSVEFDIAK